MGKRGGEPGSAPPARGPQARPRAAGRGQPRPRAWTDTHAERPERKRDGPPRGAGVSEAWAGPLLMARAAVGRGALAKRPGRWPAEGTATVTGRTRSYLSTRQRCRAGAAPSQQVRLPRLVAPAALLCSGRRPGTRTAAVAAPACFAGAPNAHARAPAAPRRLPAQRDVSASCRTMRPSPVPSAEKRSARPGTRRQAPGRVRSHWSELASRGGQGCLGIRSGIGAGVGGWLEPATP